MVDTFARIGAVLADILTLRPSMVPALVLGLLTAGLLYVYRDQIAVLTAR